MTDFFEKEIAHINECMQRFIRRLYEKSNKNTHEKG